MKRRSTKVRTSLADKLLYTFGYGVLLILMIAILYPVIFIISSSFSSGEAVSRGGVILWPVDFNLNAYKLVLEYKSVWVGYANTLFYTVVGTLVNLILTTMAAYPLARRDFFGRGIYMTLFMITMFFSGGMIPKYILMSNLELVNTRWALILSSAISVSNLIIMRTYFKNSIPDELLEASKMDGISDLGYLFKIVLPLSKTIIAVITMYYAVGHWNSYFDAMMYIRDLDKRPLQMVLREVLKASNFDMTEINDIELYEQLVGVADVMRYAMIVVTVAPILCIYPFIQKYFQKGVMIGSVKG